jgi:hypothetical protein
MNPCCRVFVLIAWCICMHVSRYIRMYASTLQPETYKIAPFDAHIIRIAETAGQSSVLRL